MAGNQRETSGSTHNETTMSASLFDRWTSSTKALLARLRDALNLSGDNDPTTIQAVLAEIAALRQAYTAVGEDTPGFSQADYFILDDNPKYSAERIEEIDAAVADACLDILRTVVTTIDTGDHSLAAEKISLVESVLSSYSTLTNTQSRVILDATQTMENFKGSLAKITGREDSTTARATTSQFAAQALDIEGAEPKEIEARRQLFFSRYEEILAKLEEARDNNNLRPDVSLYYPSPDIDQEVGTSSTGVAIVEAVEKKFKAYTSQLFSGSLTQEDSNKISQLEKRIAALKAVIMKNNARNTSGSHVELVTPKVKSAAEEARGEEEKNAEYERIIQEITVWNTKVRQLLRVPRFNATQAAEAQSLIDEAESIFLDAQDLAALSTLSSDQMSMLTKASHLVQTRVARLSQILDEGQATPPPPNEQKKEPTPKNDEAETVLTNVRALITEVGQLLQDHTFDPRTLKEYQDILGKMQRRDLQTHLQVSIQLLQRLNKTFFSVSQDLDLQDLISQIEKTSQEIAVRVEELNRNEFDAWLQQLDGFTWMQEIKRFVGVDVAGINTKTELNQQLTNGEAILTAFDTNVAHDVVIAIGDFNKTKKEIHLSQIKTLVENKLSQINLEIDKIMKTEMLEAANTQFRGLLTRWNELVALLPLNRRDMINKGITLEQMNELSESLIEEFSRLQRSLTFKNPPAEIYQLVQSFIAQAERSIAHSRELMELPDPTVMTIQEVVAELTSGTAIYESDRYKALKNRYEAAVASAGPYEQALLKNALAIGSAGIAGTSRSKDWAHNLNRVIRPFAGDNGTMQTLAMLFYEPSEGQNATDEEIISGKVPVYGRAVDMWKFITARIRHEGHFGGITSSVEVIDGKFCDHTGLVPILQGESQVKYQQRLSSIYLAVIGHNLQQVESKVPKFLTESDDDYRVRIETISDGTTVHPIYKPVDNFIVRMSGESEVQYQRRLAQIAKIDQPFKYLSLNENVVDAFNSIINLIFADIPQRQRSVLLNFYKVFGGKSVGYIPFLMRGTTRGHGFSPGEELRNDESAFLNPFALRLYKATRYKKLKRARYMTRFLYLEKDQFVSLVAQSFDPHWVGKARSAEELYDLYVLYNEVRFGSKEPLWLTEARNLFRPRDGSHLPHIHLHGKKEQQAKAELGVVRKTQLFKDAQIDLDQSLFPTIPDLVATTMDLEKRKREMLEGLRSGRLTRDAFNRQVDAFVAEYGKQGYFNYSGLVEAGADREAQLAAFFGHRILLGGQDSPNFTSVQYELAAKQFEAMFDSLDTRVGANLTKAQAHDKMNKWTELFIGKVKLVPGKHHLLLAPLTCEYMTEILRNYEKGQWKKDVNQLYRELVEELIKVGGVPGYFQTEVIRLMGGNPKKAPDYCIQGARGLLTPARYKRKLWEVENEQNDSIGYKTGSAIPFYSGDTELVPPFEHEEQVDKDATEDGDKGKH